MANKYIGILYLQLRGGLYKIASIKEGSDGSIYIATPLGPMHKGHGVDGNKFTYHPDGKTWMTSQLDTTHFTPTITDEMVHQIEGWQESGLGFRNGKLYSKDFDVNVPLADVRDLVYTKFAISYRDLKTLNGEKLMAKATDSQKINTATVIDGNSYTGLTLRFYLVHGDYLRQTLDRWNQAGIVNYHFKHLTLDLYVLVVPQDEWAGDLKGEA